MLFQQRFWAGIADGSITLTFRRWKRAQVVAGRRYRVSGGSIVEVRRVDVVTEADIDDADARRAGYEHAAALRADLRPAAADRVLLRIEMQVVDGPDPRAELAADAALDEAALAEIDRRLDRLDRASRHGPWTRPTLRMIAERPGVRAPDLAASVGRETQPFKTDVRKLKNLGLTHSLAVGYELSPRGRAYLEQRSGHGFEPRSERGSRAADG